jgi:hypothetical protein
MRRCAKQVAHGPVQGVRTRGIRLPVRVEHADGLIAGLARALEAVSGGEHKGRRQAQK